MTPDAASDESTFPRRFGEYVLVTHLGEGGMGRVYAALTPKGELCVVKRFGNPRAPLPPHLLEQNEARFLREAEITKALKHPGIARTYESAHDGTHSYLVQEFIAGSTIDYFMGALSSANQSVPIALATHIATQIADALAYLHDFQGLGLVHRDLTATNVMLSQTGEVKVIDFGIAKATLADDSLTQPNLVVGKPLWTAPEVRQGRKPDRRADLYALGLLYWYLLSGQDPTDHLGDTPTSQLPPPSTFRPEITGDLDGRALQAVHVHPDRRFQLATDFQRAIAPFSPLGYNGATELAALVRRQKLTSEDEFFAELVNRARPLLAETTAPMPSKKRRRLGVLAGAAAGVIILSVGAVLARHRRADEKPAKGAASFSPPPPLQQPHAIVASPTPPSPEPLPRHPAVPAEVAATSSRVARSTKPKLQTASPPRQDRSPTPPPADPQDLLAAAKDAGAAGDNVKALRLAQASLDTHPSVAAYLLIARLSWADKPAARAALESALRLSPGNAQATKLLLRLNR